MYDFHYKKKYAEKAQFLFTNTDFLTYHIKADVWFLQRQTLICQQ